MSQNSHHSSFWTRLTPRLRSSRHASLTRIQRRARDLMSLSSAATFFVTIWWLFVGFYWYTAITHSGQSLEATRNMLIRWEALPSPHTDWRLLLAVWLLGFAASVAPWMALRRLGHALYRHAPLTRLVARRFRGLGHAVTFNLIAGWAVAGLAAYAFDTFSFEFSSGFWGTLIAATLAYVVAHIIREGALAAEENRAFV